MMKHQVSLGGWWMYLPFFKAYITFKKFLKVLKLVLAS